MRGQSVGERGKSDRGGGGRLEGRRRETEKSAVGETGQAPVWGWQRLEDPSFPLASNAVSPSFLVAWVPLCRDLI